MRDITDNPYVKKHKVSGEFGTLNSYLFNECVVGRTVGAECFLMSVWDLLAMLKFDFQFCGFKYLARLVKRYLVSADYSEDKALSQFAEYYGTSCDFVKASILDSIRLNKDFVTIAAKYSNVPIRADCADTIGGVVDVVAALFIIYYNLDTDGADKSVERSVAIYIEKVYEYGKKR